MRYKVGLIEFTPGEYPGVLTIDDQGEGTFETSPHATVMSAVGPALKFLPYEMTAHEIQSGLDRVRYAEGLIRQLPNTHDGRNTWLLNYGQMTASDCLVRSLPIDYVTADDRPKSAPTPSHLVELRTTSSVQIEIASLNNRIAGLTAELADATASAAYHARNREKLEIERERDRKTHNEEIQKLIGERNKAREANSKYHVEVVKLTGERDEARADAERLYNMLTGPRPTPAMPQHMRPSLPIQPQPVAWGIAPTPGPGIIGDNDGPYKR